MSRAALNSLLSDPGFAPKDITPATIEARAWFMATADADASAVLGVFNDLLARGFDDEQGVPTDAWERFTGEVLPKLLGITASPPTVTPADLAIAYHSSI